MSPDRELTDLPTRTDRPDLATASHPAALATLASALASGALPLDDYLDALEQLHLRREPELRSLLPEAGRFARLRREAAELSSRYPEPATRPALFGVPVAVKDVYGVDGFATGAGSRLPPELFAGAEATAVRRLRAAGALVLGKAVSTEFAYFAPGPTRNPVDPAHTPGGSSSGSAAAVAAGLAPLALGTQTIGSIGRPAAFCGIVGFKPSAGRVPGDGVVPLAPSLDTVGTFTTDAAGARLAAALLLDGWRSLGPLPRPVLAVPEGPYLEPLEPVGREHFAAVCARLAAAGFELRRIPVMADFPAIESRHRRIVAAEAAQAHAGWFARFGELYARETVELLAAGRAVGAAQRASDLAGREQLRRELAAALGAAGADLWISPPARGPAPRGLASTGDPVMNLPWTHAGLPAIVLPAGRSADGLPLGLQVAARCGADEELLAWSALLASALDDFHRAPGDPESAA